MTPTEQRIAIAEACGWTGIIAGAIGAVGFPPGRAEAGERRTVIPAYTEDLNAMHEAESRAFGDPYFITGETNPIATKYWLELRALVLRRLPDGGWNSSEVDKVRATAKQRAEAFLRTLNLWKEEV